MTTRTRHAAPGTAAARRRDRSAPFLDRPVDLLLVNSALCTHGSRLPLRRRPAARRLRRTG